MVDIHSHILWGLDDGAKDLAESVAMLKMAAETGTTDIAATPHADLEYRYDPELAAARVAELSAATEGRPRLHRGCDFHMSLENIQECLENPAKFTINGASYLLVEFHNAFIPPATEEILRQFLERGVVPVITHPERNPLLQNATQRLQEWIRMGCLLQVTAQSLTNRFGRTAQQSAWALLRKGMVHVLASDAHDTEQRPPRLDDACETVTREMGAEAAALLLTENPSVVIGGARTWLRPAPPVHSKKKWFRFG